MTRLRRPHPRTATSGVAAFSAALLAACSSPDPGGPRPDPTFQMVEGDATAGAGQGDIRQELAKGRFLAGVREADSLAFPHAGS